MPPDPLSPADAHTPQEIARLVEAAHIRRLLG